MKRTKLTSQFSYEDLKAEHNGVVIPLFVVTADNKLRVVSTQSEVPTQGQSVIFVTEPQDEATRTISREIHRAPAQQGG